MVQRFIKRFSILLSKPKDYRDKDSNVFKVRDGISEPIDEAFAAWTTGTLEDMIEATRSETHALDRHFLLQRIVRESYKLRTDDHYKMICLNYAEIHLSEFDVLSDALKKDMGDELPSVPVFKLYATVLSEIGEFTRAIDVCEKAIEYGVHDGTKSGFEGRIQRLRKKAEDS